jgi:DNA-directed RNA polymerase subunit omega
MRPAFYYWRNPALNVTMMDVARARVPNTPVLINMVSKRVRQLNAGMRPYVKPSHPDESKLDIALREIAEGLLVAEIDFAAAGAKPEQA